ncbi:hypothetical protein BU15DRAFT_67214 [Melanogaster broomeanus]|nr:hypothetical protein BU15DRAFT_67214 [Melanogaster broomeanus]
MDSLQPFFDVVQGLRTVTCRFPSYFVLFGYLWLISLERISKGALGHPDVDAGPYNCLLVLLGASVGALMFLFIRFSPTVTCASSDLSVSFIVLMCSEAVNTTLMLYRAYRHFRHAPNVLIQNLTRDGVFYCVVMFAMSVTNVLVTFLLPVQYSQVLVMYQGVMHTILATRMQLHLRKVDRSVHLVDPSLVGSILPMEYFKPLQLGLIGNPDTKPEAHPPATDCASKSTGILQGSICSHSFTRKRGQLLALTRAYHKSLYYW